MIKAKYDWQLLPAVVDKAFLKKAKKEGLDDLAARLLYTRGIQDTASLTTFLEPALEELHDPYLMHDMEKAVARIRQAIENAEPILIYGDYDADGMTSASIVKETLDELGAESQVYLPNRFTDGYGPNTSVYKYFIKQEHISLIITVDNGVAGHEAIAYAQAQGVDVIVTDHHSLPAELPEAFAIIHPEHPAADYPFRHLAGCGVAFKLATALLEEFNLELLDLAAIGTIADMVSLTDENRIIVKYGLNVLRRTQRLGLQELFKAAGLELPELTEETVGFQIAPRLNALGRLDDPNPAVELLTGFDDGEAARLALMIDERNTERKALVQTIYQEALAMTDLTKPVQVLAKEDWHPGVLGIVAGRLLEELHQPVIVLNIEGDKAKGSARSVEAVDIFAALKPHQDLFIAFGGHAGAAGMTLQVDKISELSEVLCSFIQKQKIDLTQKKQLLLDEELVLENLSLATLKSLDKLAPYGMDHKRPVFYLRDFQVEKTQAMGQDKAHLKFRVRQGSASFDVLAFGRGSQEREFAQAKHLELAVTLSVNQWNGNTSLQLMLTDARAEGVQLYDIRSRSAQLPQGIAVWNDEQRAADFLSEEALVLNELPDDLTSLKALFAQADFQAIYFKNTIARPYYLDGYGTREQFAKLYKTVYQYPEFDIRYKLKDLAAYLKISQPLLIKMIQIFEELGFVTITDGVMTVNKEAQRREISESQIYQNLKKLVKEQELMALGTVQEIYDYLRKGE